MVGRSTTNQQPLHWITPLGFPNKMAYGAAPVRRSPGPRSFPSRSWGVSTLRRPTNWIDPRFMTSKCDSKNGALKQETWGSDQEIMGVFCVFFLAVKDWDLTYLTNKFMFWRGDVPPRAGKRNNFWELESVRNSSWENLVHCNDLVVMVG